MPKEKTTKEKLLEEFERNVFGDCFAGGNFVDNEKQAMYTSGFKEGFNRAKNMSKQFLSQAIAQTREETIREVEAEMKNIYNDEEGRGNWEYTIGYKERNNEVLDILNKLKK